MLLFVCLMLFYRMIDMRNYFMEEDTETWQLSTCTYLKKATPA